MHVYACVHVRKLSCSRYGTYFARTSQDGLMKVIDMFVERDEAIIIGSCGAVVAAFRLIFCT
jgi:hypothetical protein